MPVAMSTNSQQYKWGNKAMKKLVLMGIIITVLCFWSSAAFAMDHSFISGPFETGSQVTEKCITCHQDAASDVMQTYHFNWSGSSKNIVGQEDRTDLGKINGFNNFCISVTTNEKRCFQCHAGYGPSFEGEENVDCLVCHATDGGYKKGILTFGEPAEGVDLVAAAQSVGKPQISNCGSCHFNAGGGDAVKQGDLDSTMLTATKEHDVHMGGDLVCADCHAGENHKTKGTSVHIEPTEGKVGCESCHTSAPHEKEKLNEHIDTVACQTCHIPTFSKGLPTKLDWDWSTAGQDIEAEKDQYGKDTYAKKKGNFIWGKNVTPTYAWYNGKAERYLVGDTANLEGVTVLSKPVGSLNDPGSKIYPFKLMKGKQIADAQNKYFITPKLIGGYWKDYDWDKASADGLAAVGLDYSGEYTFANTEMYLGINHEVVPFDQALGCGDCHTENGPIDFVALGYAGDPMKVGPRFEAIQVEADVMKKDGNILVSFRAVTEALGAKITWDGTNKIAGAAVEALSVEVPIGKASASCNGSEIELGAKSVIKNGRTMVVSTLLEKAFGIKLEVDNNKVIITKE